MADNKIIVNQTINEVVVSTPGPQGLRGRTILNGIGAPSNNLGLLGDFYYDTNTTNFYGPKLSDGTWSGATIITLVQTGTEFAQIISWEIAQIYYQNNFYYVNLQHDLGFYPNVLVKTSADEYLETEVDYINDKTIRLGMAQPFSGTAYLS